MEHNQIYSFLVEQQIITYFRNVDDIFTIYEQNRTNAGYTLNKFNKLQTFIKLIMGKELHESINF
jgi:hypothetical protein